MTNTKILEMLMAGEIEMLKSAIQEEIRLDELSKKSGGAKNRAAAMKKFFKFPAHDKPICNYPCENVEVLGGKYNSFMTPYSFALTIEDIPGDMEKFNPDTMGEYFKINHVANTCDAISTEKIDISKIFADAKAQGYRYKKDELNCFKAKYYFEYKGDYFKIGLLEQVFKIIDDGEAATVYYRTKNGMLHIETSIGIVGILPTNYKDKNGFLAGKIIIPVE